MNLPVGVPTRPTSEFIQSNLVPDVSPEVQAVSGLTSSGLSMFNGEKFAGGYGETLGEEMDYWTLRARSAELYGRNHYARGIIQRLTTNEINTGLTPEAMPESSIVGVDEEALNEWSDNVETRFALWAKNPTVCDVSGQHNFNMAQALARQEALVVGDVLVTLVQSTVTKLPQYRLIRGDRVRNPVLQDVSLRDGHTLTHGVERDKNGRHVAFYVLQEDLSYKRVRAFGSRTGRKSAWLVYGTTKRLEEVRGVPLLGIVLQSLKEIDRYRDSVQRKATVASWLAIWIEKSQNMPGSIPFQAAAIAAATKTATDSDGVTRDVNIEAFLPGMIMNELQFGEKPHAFGSEGTDLNFGEFEQSIVNSIAWALEIPPEILVLSFNSNYSASAAAINEFRLYIDRVWGDFGDTFCTPIYTEWLISEVIKRKISAKGFLNAWRDMSQYDIFGSWTAVAWIGSVKPSTDMLKTIKGLALAVEQGWLTNSIAAKGTTGQKFSRMIKTLKRENELKAEAARPMAEFEAEFGAEITNRAFGSVTREFEPLTAEQFSAMMEQHEEGK